MTDKIPPSDALRLSKILALTYSDNDGEALSALRTAQALLSKYGEKLSNLTQACSQVDDVSDIPGWALRWGNDCLNDWESEFCEDLLKRGTTTFSSKQRAKLLGIRAKIYAHYNRATVEEVCG